MKRSGRYLAAVALLLGCDSGGQGPGRADAGAVAAEVGPLRNVVMVVDDGFDPSVAELSGKVVASHTIGCVPSSDGADGGAEAGADPLAQGANPDFAQAKHDLIAALREPDRSCWLTQGMLPYAQPILASVDGYRDRWNAALRADTDLTQAFTSAEYAAIVSALQSAPRDARVHGTSVAGLWRIRIPTCAWCWCSTRRYRPARSRHRSNASVRRPSTRPWPCWRTPRCGPRTSAGRAAIWTVCSTRSSLGTTSAR